MSKGRDKQSNTHGKVAHISTAKTAQADDEHRPGEKYNGMGKRSKQPHTPSTDLTGKQLHFARCIAQGMTKTEAYIEAYEASNMARKTINEAACRLSKDKRIEARVQHLIALKEQALIRSTVGLKSQVLTKLVHFMDNAQPSDSAKLRAAELLGKSIGLFKDVIEDNRYADKSPEELTALLHERLSEIADASSRTVN